MMRAEELPYEQAIFRESWGLLKDVRKDPACLAESMRTAAGMIAVFDGSIYRGLARTLYSTAVLPYSEREAVLVDEAYQRCWELLKKYGDAVADETFGMLIREGSALVELFRGEPGAYAAALRTALAVIEHIEGLARARMAAA